MICILCLLLSASALKLQQDPEFDITDMSYDEECGNRYNYKCWKKGGHSLDKHERAHFQMHSNKAVSITLTPPAACNTNTKVTFGDAGCGATYAIQVMIAKSGTVDGNQCKVDTANVLSAVKAGSGCTGGSSGTAKPATSVPTQINTGNAALHGTCNTGAKIMDTVTAITVTTTALTGLKLAMLEMRGNGLHSGEKPLVGPAHATKKCYSLACHDTATNCALAPAASVTPSVALFCASSVVVMRYYSDAACATAITATTNGHGAASTGLAIASKSANCFQIGLSHWWCPNDFVMAQGAC